METITMGLDLEHLRTLVTFADTGSVKGTARVVHKTPSAVSTQLSKLAETVGRPLLKKRGRGLELTPDGVEVAKTARRMVALEHEIMARFNASDFAGTLRVGLPDDYVPMLMSPLFDALESVAPLARLEVQCAPSADLRPLIANAELDFALLSEPSGSKRGVLLRREEVVWASGTHGSQIAQGTLPLALFPEGCVVRAAALSMLDTHGIAYDVVCESQSMAAIQSAVSAGIAIAPLARSCVPPSAHLLWAESGLPAQESIEIIIATSPSMTAPLSTALIERLRERVR